MSIGRNAGSIQYLDSVWKETFSLWFISWQAVHLIVKMPDRIFTNQIECSILVATSSNLNQNKDNNMELSAYFIDGQK
jgi:hypothetical protein